MSTPTKHSATVTTPTATQILITRRFAAPKHLVVRTHTEPDLVRRWWAGERGEMTVCEIDLRVGGSWRYAMTANGGFEVAFSGEYREIEPHDRIVRTEIFEAMPGESSTVTVELTATEGGTILTMLSEYASEATRDAVIGSGMEGGMQEGMDALERVAIELGA